MSRAIKIKKTWNNFRFTLGFLLLFFYLGISFLFLFTDKWKDLIPQNRTLIGLIMLGFAVLRFYVSYSRFKNKKIKISATNKPEKEKANE